MRYPLQYQAFFQAWKLNMRTIISSRRSIFISRRPQQIQEGLADTSASVSARRRRHLILHSTKAPRLAPCCSVGGRFGSWSLVRWSGGRRRKQSGLLRGRHRWLQEVEVVSCAARSGTCKGVCTGMCMCAGMRIAWLPEGNHHYATAVYMTPAKPQCERA